MLRLKRTVRTSATLALGASLAALVACGSSAQSTAGATGPTGTGGHSSASATTGTGGKTTATASGSGGGGPVCPGAGFGGGEKAAPGGSVTATVVDQNGAAVAGQPVFICGTDICSSPGKTDANGKVAISTTLMMKKPAFKFGDSVTYAELAIPLSMTSNDFMTIGTGKLPAAGAALTVGADAVSGGVTVSVPKGGAVGIDVLLYDTPEKQQLRAVSIPIAAEGPVLAPIKFADGGAGFSLLFGVAPAETTLCPAAKVKVALPNDKMMPNNLGWAPKAAVEFWIMSVDPGQQYAPYAGWAKASDGVVSDDGASVSTSDGGGFTFLQTFGIRLKKP